MKLKKSRLNCWDWQLLEQLEDIGLLSNLIFDWFSESVWCIIKPQKLSEISSLTEVNVYNLKLLPLTVQEKIFKEIKCVLTTPELKTLVEIVLLLKHFEDEESSDFNELVNKIELSILGFDVNTNFDEISESGKNLINSNVNNLHLLLYFLLSVANQPMFFCEESNQDKIIFDLRKQTAKKKKLEKERMPSFDYTSNKSFSSKEQKLKIDSFSKSNSKVKKPEANNEIFFELYKMLGKVYKNSGKVRNSFSSYEKELSEQVADDGLSSQHKDSNVSKNKEILSLLKKVTERLGLKKEEHFKKIRGQKRQSLFSEIEKSGNNSETTKSRRRRRSDSILLISQFTHGVQGLCSKERNQSNFGR